MSSSVSDNNSMPTMCVVCGKTGDLKKCGGCEQVKYCNSKCQQLHWSKHKKECKLAASSGSTAGGIGSIKLSDEELTNLCSIIEQIVLLYENEKLSSISDDELFRDPPPKEDCPICMLPMPWSPGLNDVGTTYQLCCGKIICAGCLLATGEQIKRGNMKNGCPFCRMPLPKKNEQVERCERRVKLNDAEALFVLGTYYGRGEFDLPRDMKKAFELWNKAADLGLCRGHYKLDTAYYHGMGVEKDLKLAIYHFELAAIGGHEEARHFLGGLELDGNVDRVMKHFVISASAGFDDSMQAVGRGYKAGLVTKEEYASTLRAFQASVDEMKSDQRVKAAAAYANGRYYVGL